MSQEQAYKMKILKQLGANIRAERLSKNISQEELAFKINSARNFIGCIERAEKAPTIVTLYKIAGALEIPIGNLLSSIK